MMAAICIFFVWKFKQLTDALVLHAYLNYVSLDYMPAVKELTGKWPANLNGLPRYAQAEKNRTTAYYVREQLDGVLKFHKDNYRGFKIMHSDDKKCSFTLYSKGQVVEHDSDLENAN